MKILFCLFLSVCVFFASPAFADMPTAVYDGKINNFIGNVIEQKILAQGFAANDARMAATYSSVSAQVAAKSTAYGKTITAGLSVRWLPVLLTAAVIGSAYLIYKNYYLTPATSSTYTPSGSDLYNPSNYDGYLSAIPPVTGYTNRPAYGFQPFTTTHLTSPNDFIFNMTSVNDGTYNMPLTHFIGAGDLYSSALALAGEYNDFLDTRGAGYHIVLQGCQSPSGTALCQFASRNLTNGIEGSNRLALTFYKGSFAVPTIDCPNGVINSLRASPYTPTCVTTSIQPAQRALYPLDWASDLVTQPPEDDTSPLDPAILAPFINQVWQSASSASGYTGFPYSASNPVTVGDVARVQTSLGVSATPTLGSALNQVASSAVAGATLTPVVNDATQTSTPAPDATTNTASTTGTPTSTVSVDLGPDPNTPPPTLENIPTAATILSPFFGLFPALRSFVVPAHTGTCPTATFDLFGHSYTMDSQCVLAESIRSPLSVAMTVFWSLAALFILLAA